MKWAQSFRRVPLMAVCFETHLHSHTRARFKINVRSSKHMHICIIIIIQCLRRTHIKPTEFLIFFRVHTHSHTNTPDLYSFQFHCVFLSAFGVLLCYYSFLQNWNFNFISPHLFLLSYFHTLICFVCHCMCECVCVCVHVLFAQFCNII